MCIYRAERPARDGNQRPDGPGAARRRRVNAGTKPPNAGDKGDTSGRLLLTKLLRARRSALKHHHSTKIKPALLSTSVTHRRQPKPRLWRRRWAWRARAPGYARFCPRAVRRRFSRAQRPPALHTGRARPGGQPLGSDAGERGVLGEVRNSTANCLRGCCPFPVSTPYFRSASARPPNSPQRLTGRENRKVHVNCQFGNHVLYSYT